MHLPKNNVFPQMHCVCYNGGLFKCMSNYFTDNISKTVRSCIYIGHETMISNQQ